MSSFLDKLPPEIRLSIYGFVFSTHSPVIRPSRSRATLGIARVVDHKVPRAEDVRLDTSLLAASNSILAEALPALYATKIVRATTVDFGRLLEHADFAELVRYIEIADCAGTQETSNSHSVLQRL